MALQYKLSEVQGTQVIVHEGLKILEMQMKYIRYQLILDDEEMRRKLIALLTEAAPNPAPVKQPLRMPKFYRG